MILAPVQFLKNRNIRKLNSIEIPPLLAVGWGYLNSYKRPYIMSQATVHPLEERGVSSRFIEPCILVIFGATGDLTARKLLPAIYNLAREGQLPTQFACIGFARREK